MEGRLAICLLLSGCDIVFGLDTPEPTPPDATSVTGCFGKYDGGLLEICLDGAIATEYVVAGATSLSTSECELVVEQSDGSEVCVIAAERIAINAELSVVGSRPLVLVATDTMTVDGTIDVASHKVPPRMGAGAHPAACANTDGIESTTGGSGGAGGSFARLGGHGGMNADGVQRAASGVEAMLQVVRGGCHGGLGGRGATPGSPGSAGLGGGAVYLIAGSRLVVNAPINASGSAGIGGTSATSNAGGGGGGGGSGGLIGLDARTIELDSAAVLLANGGGGGGGGGTNGLASDGFDPDPAEEDRPALAGAGGTPNGGAGGTGFAGMTDAGAGLAGGSGGGGGGGAGFIRIYTPDLTSRTTRISPDPG